MIWDAKYMIMIFFLFVEHSKGASPHRLAITWLGVQYC